MFRNKELIYQISMMALKAGIAVVIAVICVNYFQDKIVEITSSLRTQKRAAFALQRRSETVRQLQNEFKNVGPVEAYLAAASPEADSVVDFKAALESLAGRQSLPSTVDFSLPSYDQTTIDYVVSLSTGAASLTQYLKNFEKIPYLTGIKGVSINSNQDSSWENASRIILSGRLFTTPLPK